jgi:hypothetical protein
MLSKEKNPRGAQKKYFFFDWNKKKLWDCRITSKTNQIKIIKIDN